MDEIIDQKEDWEPVATFTSRMKVPGGWLYRYKLRGYPPAIAFVPNNRTAEIEDAKRRNRELMLAAKRIVDGKTKDLA